MPSMPPRALLLDVMSTLVYDPFMVEMPAFLGITFEELLAAKDPTAWVEFELAEIDEPELFRRFFADGRPIDGPGLKRDATRHYRLLDGIEALLERLHQEGVPMHALSNYPHWYREIEQVTQLSRFLKWDFVSWDTRLRKPDPRAYLHACESLDLKPAECLFVDDTKVNVDAAQALGMPAIWFQDADQLGRELRAHGLLAGSA